jgi:excinuclease UvrABC ATPase subunit
LRKRAKNGDKPRHLSVRRADHRPRASDVQVLIKTFRDLIDRGNSVLVIEHNTQLIEKRDWVIDLGPRAATAAARSWPVGTPEEIAANPRSNHRTGT